MDSSNAVFHQLMQKVLTLYDLPQSKPSEAYEVEVEGCGSLYFLGHEPDYIKLLFNIDRLDVGSKLSRLDMLKLNRPALTGHPIIVSVGEDHSVTLWARLSLHDLGTAELMQVTDTLTETASLFLADA